MKSLNTSAMDLITEKVSPGLVKYLRILQGSKKFKNRIKVFREKHIEKSAIFKDKDTLEGDLDGILKDFFIPVNEDNSTYLYMFCMTGMPSYKYNFHIDFLASEEKPHMLRIDEPSIIVQVRDHLSSREWAKMRTQLERISNKLEDMKGISTSMERLRKEGNVPKRWSNIDLLLEIYERREKDLSEIHDEIPKIKERIGHRKKKRMGHEVSTVYSIDDVRRLLKQITELIGSL